MNKARKTLEKALIRAGSILKPAISKPKHIQYKSAVDLVTETDKKIESVIIDIIKHNFPDHSILAEESPPEGSSHHKWIIDPIDGTTNFAHGLGQACVSIAYEQNGKIMLGGVFNPFSNECFWAERGKGARLNGKKIHVSSPKRLSESLLVTGFPYDRTTRADYYLKFVKHFITTTHGIRRLGSAALDLCFVACGRFDGYWEFNLNPWDVAAGALIVEEAGGKLSNFLGQPMSIYEKQFLATNGKIHDEMLKIIKLYL
jgi:myo-inositol-1(or 4)-monophosphatase